MKISLNWLSQYVDIQDYKSKPQDLANLLTNKGLEVESVEDRAKQFENVVVGHILEKKQHPDADRLSVCQVSIGGGIVQQIVCGAKNHKEGDRVVASLPGAVLPGNFEIKKSKIRGVESLGMLCSEVELGLAKESAGIMILPQDAPIGEAFAKYMGYDDIVFEIKVTANRADCLSHYGLAREVGCLLGREVSLPIGTFEITSQSTRNLIKLEVQDHEGCPRYAGRVIKGVKVGPSPQWLRQAVESIGLNSINNIVDVTNYVMMELGQPLHAFDTKFIEGAFIKVGRAERGETFTSLDGTEIKLEGSELMIRDAKKNIAMAGVVGGKNSGVQEDTTQLFIECAYFSPSTVRKTSRKHGIQTDSAYRFSRGVDPDGTLLALNRCSELIQKVAGGEIFGDHYDVYPKPLVRDPITVTAEQVSQKLGYKIAVNEFSDWMSRIGCKLESKSNDTWVVTPPSFRPDIDIKEDLMEEFARLKGYEHIPEIVPVAQVEPTAHASHYTLSRWVGRKLQSEGFQQAVNFGFVSEKLEKTIVGNRSLWKSHGIELSSESIRIKNPLSEDLNVMRSSLLTHLIQNALHNERHGSESGRLFEVGYAFDKSEAGYVEDWRLGIVSWGESVDLWKKSKTPHVLEVKTAIENVLKGLGAKSWSWTTSENAPECLHPGQSAYLFFEGKVVGFVGTLHPTLADELKLRSNTVVGEFDLSLLLQGQPRAIKTKSISKFPAVERDLAFVIPKTLASGDVVTAIKKAAGQQLISCRVFDVFEGAPLETGQLSVAFRLVYQDLAGTLTEEQITQLQKKVIADVSSKLGVSVRG